MNQDMVWQLVRYLLLAAGGYLTSKGLADEATVQALVTAIGTIAIGAWGVYVKWRTVTVPAAVVVASQESPTVPTIPTVSAGTGAVQVNAA